MALTHRPAGTVVVVGRSGAGKIDADQAAGRALLRQRANRVGERPN